MAKFITTILFERNHLFCVICHTFSIRNLLVDWPDHLQFISTDSAKFVN